MGYRALALVLGLAACSSVSFAQLSDFHTNNDLPAPRPNSFGQVSISGVVTDAIGTPLHDIRIDVQQVGNGKVVQSTYSRVNGTFEFVDLNAGDYEVVAVDGVNQTDQQVRVDTQLTNVNLQLPIHAAPRGGTVSVAELRTPEKARHLVDKARSALAKKKFDEADKAINEALSVAPDYADALTMRAVLKLSKNQLQSALDDLDHAVKSDPSYAQAYLVLGATYNQMGRFDDALRSLDRSVMYDPKSWQCAVEMSRAMLGKKDYQRAFQQANRAETLGGNKVLNSLHLLKAYALMGEKQLKQAAFEFEAYLTAEPNGDVAASARATLAQIRTEMAQNPAALTLPTMTGFFAEAH